jgi:hypothetical protein
MSPTRASCLAHVHIHLLTLINQPMLSYNFLSHVLHVSPMIYHVLNSIYESMLSDNCNITAYALPVHDHINLRFQVSESFFTKETTILVTEVCSATSCDCIAMSRLL